jgi:hypothetical protein
MTDTERGGGSFLARWSERKQRAREGPAQAADAAPTAAPLAETSAAEPEAPERLLTDADMPPLESLDANSDYSVFLSPGVSESLRKKALARLFHSPHLNITDGLDDYAEDYTSFAALGDLVTADVRHRLEQSAERLADEDTGAQAAADATCADRPTAETAPAAADPGTEAEDDETTPGGTA